LSQQNNAWRWFVAQIPVRCGKNFRRRFGWSRIPSCKNATQGVTIMPESNSATILIVDDAVENLAVLNTLLLPYYQVLAATSGEKALRIAAAKPSPDLILLDVMMPSMDGYQVFARLRSHPSTAAIPVIFVTAMASAEAEMHGLTVGAVDYISKPIVPSIVLARIHIQLELKQARDRLADQNNWLEAEVERRMAENELTQEVSIRALACLAEMRDLETGNHIVRTQTYVQHLASMISEHPRFEVLLTPRYIQLLARSAPLHDIGKVGVPDAILGKPGPLTAEEWAIMQTHAKLGSDAIEKAEKGLAQPLDFLYLAKEIAHWHHEKWDGTGYPDGLAGESIPVSSRIMALADVFDALISRRVYKRALAPAEVKTIIAAGRGRSFDPDIADYFLAQFELFCDIAMQHCDPVD
jgi:putative two-component system response regulator